MFGKSLAFLPFALLLTLGGLARAATTVTDPAAVQVQTFYAVLVDTMKHGPQLGMEGRYKALAPAVDAAFDLATMMQFIVGPSWSTMSQSMTRPSEPRLKAPVASPRSSARR